MHCLPFVLPVCLPFVLSPPVHPDKSQFVARAAPGKLGLLYRELSSQTAATATAAVNRLAAEHGFGWLNCLFAVWSSSSSSFRLRRCRFRRCYCALHLQPNGTAFRQPNDTDSEWATEDTRRQGTKKKKSLRTISTNLLLGNLLFLCDSSSLPLSKSGH